jgi:hypothetical protein
MAAALTTPIVVAAIVLAVAGLAKLRSPGTAVRALAAAGLPLPGAAASSSLPRAAVRAIAAGELALAGLVLFAPGRASCALLAAMYAVLALVARTLVRRGTSCGCFGEADTPATAAHVWLSAALALVAAAGAAWSAHGIAWLLRGTPGVVAPLALGIAGAAYAAVLAYTELPGAWSAWRPR